MKTPLLDALADGAPTARRELWGWCWIAISALAIAGLFALLLALSRIPGAERVMTWPIDFFHKGLVIHVVFSFVVWLLAVFGALTCLAARLAGTPAHADAALGRAALACMIVAAPMLFVPALLDRGEATLNDYVPVIIDPLYYSGLALLAASVALAAMRLLGGTALRALSRAPEVAAIFGAAVAILFALGAFAVAAVRLVGDPPSHAFNQDLLWAGGHLLQFVNTQIMLVAWVALATTVLGRTAVPAPLQFSATLLIVIPTVTAPFLFVYYEPFSAEETLAFTNLQYALIPPTLLVGGAVALALRRCRAWRDPAFLSLTLSLVLFAVGGTFGLFVDGADTRTPAHYHGVIAAVTVACMGMFHTVFLPALGRNVGRGTILSWQLWMFAGGQLAACAGLFLAGGYGAPRKIAGAAQGLDAIGAWMGMALNGLGGLVAVIGGILFVWTIGSALLRRTASTNPEMTSPLRP